MERKYGSPNPPHLALKVGKRTVLAKTCLNCGVLSSGSNLVRDRRGYIRPNCRLCINADNRGRTDAKGYNRVAYRGPRGGLNTTEYQRAIQAESLPGATNHYQQYTGADWDIILSKDLTNRDKAKKLGRTYKAIINARDRHKRLLEKDVND